MIAAPFMPLCLGQDWENYIKRLESFAEKTKNNPAYRYSEAYDIVSKEKNIALYDLFVQKLKETIYQKRPNNPALTFEQGRDNFVLLNEKEQAQMLSNALQVFGRISGGCDLTGIGGAPRAAATVSVSTALSNWKKLYSDVRIIDSSASGLWEKKSRNLLDLL